MEAACLISIMAVLAVGNGVDSFCFLLQALIPVSTGVRNRYCMPVFIECRRMLMLFVVRLCEAMFRVPRPSCCHPLLGKTLPQLLGVQR
jgi:hypothetical protein